jgi:hypothetical protein
MLPSFYLSNDKAYAWSVTRAAAYGAGIGAVAALLRSLGPLHGPFAASVRPGGLLPVFPEVLPEIVCAALGFAVLCAAAAALRNFLAQRLIWPENNR